MKLRSPHSHLHPGFSQVELIVSIAIVAVLMAVLIPTLGTVRDSANRSHCLSNLRQLSTAMHIYIADQNRMPDWQNWHLPMVEDGTREYWHQERVGSHVNSMPTVSTSPIIDEQVRSWSPTRTNYAMNLRISNHSTHGVKNLDQIEEPSRILHFTYGAPGESYPGNTYMFSKFVGWTQSGSAPIRRERYFDNGHALLVYFDGSTDRISREEGIALNRLNDTESRLFWHGRY